MILNGSLIAVDDISANSGLLLTLRTMRLPDPEDPRRDLGDVLRVKVCFETVLGDALAQPI